MLKIDLHTHSLASGHAYSTIFEMVQYAKKIGLEVIAITDHGPSMEGAPTIGYFANMGRIPCTMEDVRILRGCEANIIDLGGNIDLNEDVAKGLDLVLAGLHKFTPYPCNASIHDNTKAIIGAISNGLVNIISHPYRLDFPVDIGEVAKAASHYGVLLELNISLVKIFGSNNELLSQINLMIEVAEKLGVKIVISSDAHIAMEIGDDSILSECNIKIPSGLVFGSKDCYNEVMDFLV